MNPKAKRTHIVLDAELIEQGLRVTGLKTRRELIDFALRELLRREDQKKLLELKDHQLLLGDESFVERYKSDHKTEELGELSKAHKRSLALSLDEYRSRSQSRDEAMAKAYLSGAYTMAEIGQYFGVHYMTVSRAVRKLENK
jgi:Arc/MetJ family transcription regulator